jgi:hypothetical protein
METLCHKINSPSVSSTETEACPASPSLYKAPEPDHTGLSVITEVDRKACPVVMVNRCCLVQGIGTHDGTLIRNIVSRSEIDLNLIKRQFQKMYGETLSSMIMVSHGFPILMPICSIDIPGRPECCHKCPSLPVDITLALVTI